MDESTDRSVRSSCEGATLSSGAGDTRSAEAADGQRSMRPMAVVVLDVFVDDGFEMSTAEDEHPIQTFTSDGPDKPFSKGICTGCPDRGVDDPNAFGTEDLIEARGELGVPVPDKELDRMGTLSDP